jgi:hypothetical protein
MWEEIKLARKGFDEKSYVEESQQASKSTESDKS